MDLSTCLVAVSPLLLPIRDNPVSLEGVGSVRGIPVTLSDPTQFFSMKPAVNQNNTFVYNRCTAQNYSCIAEHGGVYTPPTNVIRTNSYNSWNGTAGADVESGSYVFYNDLMTIEGEKIPGFPFFTYQQAADSFAIQPGLGLGPNSTFIRAALDLDIVPSRQWSYWGGDAVSDIEGHVILGGYDVNRVDGDFTTLDIDPLKLLWITITDMTWVSSSGNRTALFANTGYTQLEASIDPFNDYIAIPQTVRNNFQVATNSYVDNASGLIAYNSRPAGSLDITLSNNLVVSIPAQDLFDHGLTYDSDGNANTSTYNFWTPKVYRDTTYPDYTLNFGAPFLARKYLVTDFDRAKYHLADAASGTASPLKMQPLCTGGPASSSQTPTPGKKTNVGAIAGGVVGGVVGLAIIGALIFFFLIRPRRQKAKQAPTAETGLATSEKEYPQPPPQHLSGVPPNAPVFVEKDGVAATGQPAPEKGRIQSSVPSSMGELPSPSTEFSEPSRTSHGYGYRQENTPQVLVEMPAERYD